MNSGTDGTIPELGEPDSGSGTISIDAAICASCDSRNLSSRTQRGNRRADIFFSAQDRHVYLSLLKQYGEHYRIRFLGYCLMSNHVHLVVVPTDEVGLAKAMREVNGRYARYRNVIDRGCGHVWQGRFYSCPFEGVRLASVMRYIELNPVRAGLVSDAADYAWSSAITHLGGADSVGLLDTAEWNRDWSPEQWKLVLANARDEGDAIRAATYAGRPFGGEEFVETLEARCGRRLRPAKPGPKLGSRCYRHENSGIVSVCPGINF